MDLLRLIALRALGVAHWGNDLRLLGAALIKLEKRTRNLEARVGEFDLAGAETGSDPWWEDPAQLAELWRWLEERGMEPTDPPHFMEHPWRWDSDYQDMRKAERAPA
jgi:hypothetical protein